MTVALFSCIRGNKNNMKTFYLFFVGVLTLLFVLQAQAKVYKCSANGKMTYSSKPCEPGGVEKKSRFSRMSTDTRNIDDAVIKKYLQTSKPNAAKEVYRQFYDVFDCKGFNKGMSVFPRRDTVSYIAYQSFKEPQSPAHKLQRRALNYSTTKPITVGRKCYMNLSRDRKGRLQFGMYSFASKDIKSWTTKKIATQLTRLGYKFEQLDNSFKTRYDYEWKARGVECKIDIDHTDEGRRTEHISVAVKCKLD